LIMSSGAALSRRSTVNFLGAGVTCVDNPGSARTDCTVTGGISASGVYLYSSTASATSAAAAENTIIGAGSGSLDLPAGYFDHAGDSVIISSSGYYSTPIAPGTLRIRLKVGAATILDTGAWTPLPSITNAVWELNTRITVRLVGVGGTIMSQSEFRPGVGVPVGQSWPMLNTAAVALDTTTANTMALTAEWSAATGETITGTNFLMHGITTGAGVSTSGYATLQNDTTPITQRATANFGSGTVCVDNAGSGRSDCYVGMAVANEGGTGTTVNKLAKLTGAPSTAIISTAADTGGAVGIVVAGAGMAGSAVIATGGTVNCVFDGATTAGHYVGISAGTAGDCTSVGATYPTSGQVIGRVLSTNGGAGTYAVVLFGPEVKAPGSLLLTSTPGTDHTVSGVTAQLTAGTNLTFGQICYMGADGKMELGDATVIATAGVWAMATATIAENDVGTFLLQGFAIDASWAWGTLGSLLVLDKTTPGAMVLIANAPAAANNAIQVVGVVRAATVVYFNPQLVMVEHL
jgi:hypothetical protein